MTPPNRQLLAAALIVSVSGLTHASQPQSVDDLPDPDPQAQIDQFVLPEGFEISLFASDPMIRKPVQMNWDAQGRLWVVSSTTYPQIKPGAPTVDQVIVLEDTDGDGRADQSTVFAEELHIPTAILPADGGVYVANSTELLFLEDTDGDLKEDKRTVVLSGFGTEDTHHLLHTLRFGPEGLMYFLQSIYIHSHIETPWGVRRLLGGGVWEFRAENRRLEVLSKGLINPWGFEFDRWGQSFATDGAGSEGVNYVFPGSVFKTSPGASRVLDGLSPGQPKHCGLEVIEEPHLPDDWQGNFITCDFRGNRINRFKLERSGSSYIATQLEDVLASTHRAFRPVDVRVGPDGALYIADWYNPIIQHGEVDFRDPRRDHVHGRIWRMTAKGRPLSENPKLAGAPVPDLLEALRSDRNWVRRFAKQELRDRGAAEVAPAVMQWSQDLDPATEEGAHALLEGAWAREGVNAFSPELWKKLWTSADPRVRSGALRILTHRWRVLPHREDYLKEGIADDDAQVRLWTVAVCAAIGSPGSVEIALRALDKPVDESIDFLLEKLCRDRAEVWLPEVLSGKLKLNSKPAHQVFALRAAGRSDALGPMFRLLSRGVLDETQQTQVLAAAAASMDVKKATDLATLISNPEAKVNKAALAGALVEAAQKRKIKPSEPGKWLAAWLKDDDLALRAKAAELVGWWKIEAQRPALVAVLESAEDPAVVRSAVQGLAALGGEASRDLLDAQLKKTEDKATQALLIEGMTKVGPGLASLRAVNYLKQASGAGQTAAVMTVFLQNKQLPGQLAKALDGQTIPQEIAVEAIRMATTRGIEGPLVDALKKAGGVKSMDAALSPEELAAMVEKVKTEGDAARGEEVYRIQSLLCLTCHAIGEAGGVIGPNMVSIGASAPVDYLIESLLEPSKKIKEGYHMVIVNTKDGGVISGGLVQDGDSELVIRDPANNLITVPKGNVASKQMSPVSMMPAGLTASLREDQFVDLVKFLSELGREGEYKTGTERFIRTWRYMGPMAPEAVEHVRHVGLHALHETDQGYPWLPIYSKVSGGLPVAELGKTQRINPWFPHVVQFALQMDAAGAVTLDLSHHEGVLFVVEDEVMKELDSKVTLDLDAGTNRVSVLLTREAGEKIEDFFIEILDGPAKVVMPQ